MSLADIAARQQTIAAQLIAGDTIDLDGLIVELPEQVQATLRHEHHGDLVLKFDLKWFDRPTALYPPHHPPHHHWVFSYEGELTLGQAGELLDRVGNQLAEQGAVTFDEHTVDVPAEALMVVRYERARWETSCSRARSSGASRRPLASSGRSSNSSRNRMRARFGCGGRAAEPAKAHLARFCDVTCEHHPRERLAHARGQSPRIWSAALLACARSPKTRG